MATEIYGKRNHHDDVSVLAQKAIKLFDSASAHSAAIIAPSSLAADYTLTLPADDGTPNQVLATDGSGVLSWVTTLTSALTTNSILVGVSSVATQVDTAAQGDIAATSAGLNIKSGVIINTDINASAAIAYSKLNLTGSIVDADVASGAAIALSKLAALTISRALVSDGSGVVSVSTTTSTELGYVHGVTSAIQTQLDAKARGTAANWITSDGATKAITHSLGSTDIIVAIYDKTDSSLIEIDSVVATDSNTVTLTSSVAPGAAGWRVVIARV